MNKNNYKKALQHFEKGANYDNQFATLFSAILHLSGYKLSKRNPRKAMEYFKTLASKWNNRVAEFFMGVMYCEGDEGISINPVEGFRLILSSGNNSWVYSYSYIAKAYQYGRFVKTDHKKALEWYNKLLDNNDDTSATEFNLFGNKKFKLKFDEEILTGAVQSYLESEPVSVIACCLPPTTDFMRPLAFEMQRLAFWKILTNVKSNAVVPCYSHISVLYLNGESNVPRDVPKAVEWGLKAITREHPDADASRFIGAIYQKGMYLNQDYKEAMRLYKQSYTILKEKDTESPFLIGCMYLRGLGIKKDWKKAITYLGQAAFRGKNGDAFYLMGHIYENGKHGVPFNPTDAMKCYQNALTLGTIEGATGIGLLYYHGKGVDENLHEAMKWIREAASMRCPLGSRLLQFTEMYGLHLAVEQVMRHVELEDYFFNDCDKHI